MPTLAQITIFPIKSLDGVSLTAAEITSAGGLEHDRRFALVDRDGRFINGKGTYAVHRLRAEYDLAAGAVRLRREGDAGWETFALAAGDSPLAAWLSDFFHTTVKVVEDREGGFPDDKAAPGPTVVSTQSLEEVARWFGISLPEARRRFRANLEIDAEAAFWEDRLFGPGPPGALFQIGDVSLVGTNPCARCVVPSRSSESGAATPGFAKMFARRRAEMLPPWAARERFDHFYRLAVNTRVVTPAAGAVRVGDAVRILAPTYPEHNLERPP
jgi:uncharacterized protein